ncbi:MAG TPA: hypothetical protein VNW15_07480 [Rhizomicrobium sp.]|jgi:hypothetical protein|nr:hypothetical protein [Rhizomicrobium sp.]
MNANRTMVPVGLGFRALKGGSVVVGVALDKSGPRVVLSSFLPTASEGDRLSLEPYHLAAGMERGPHGGASMEAKAAIAEGRKRQNKLAVAGLKDVLRKLRKAGSEPVVAALLVNRAGWITDLLDYSLAFADHPPVAETLAVRDALRFAFARLGVEVAEMDEKSLDALASKALRLSPADLGSRLKALGAAVGRPWRKEQKLACLAAWVALKPLKTRR